MLIAVLIPCKIYPLWVNGKVNKAHPIPRNINMSPGFGHGVRSL